MLRKKVVLTLVVAGLAVGLGSFLGASRAQADEPFTISPAVYRTGDTLEGGARIQLVHRGFYGGGYGWGGGYGGGWGGGYRGYYGPGPGIGVYAPVYRRYPGFGYPVYTTPVYAAPVYGYPGVGYPGYAYPGCW